LIEWLEDQRVELFDLESDPGEKNDLARHDAPRALALRAELKAWQRATGVRFPTANPAYDPAKPGGRVSPRPTEKGSATSPATKEAAAKKAKAPK
jgi:hypothetical protein